MLKGSRLKERLIFVSPLQSVRSARISKSISKAKAIKQQKNTTNQSIILSVLLRSIWPPLSPMRRTDGRHRWRTCRSWPRVRCCCSRCCYCRCCCCYTPVLVICPLTHLLSTCSSGSHERWQRQGAQPPNRLHSQRWAPLFFLSSPQVCWIFKIKWIILLL